MPFGGCVKHLNIPFYYTPVNPKVYYLNLARRGDRNAWFREHNRSRGVPQENLVRINAIDGGSFDSAKALQNAMGADGEFVGYVNHNFKDEHRASMANTWGYLIALKRIVLSNEPGFIFEDDFALKVSWEAVLSSIEALFGLRKPIFIAGLRCGFTPNKPLLSFEPTPVEGWYYHIRGSVMQAAFYTPAGAQLLLSIMTGQQGIPCSESIEATLAHIESIATLPGMYTRKPTPRNDDNDMVTHFHSKSDNTWEKL